jgi:hypothetical protein
VKVRLEQAGVEWQVSGGGVTAKHTDLDVAACSAVRLAELMGATRIELGEGVPADAVERGRKLRMRLLSMRSGGG